MRLTAGNIWCKILTVSDIGIVIYACELIVWIGISIGRWVASSWEYWHDEFGLIKNERIFFIDLIDTFIILFYRWLLNSELSISWISIVIINDSET